MFLICRVTSRDSVLNGLFGFMGGSPSWQVTTLQCLMSIDVMQVGIITFNLLLCDLTRQGN